MREDSLAILGHCSLYSHMLDMFLSVPTRPWEKEISYGFKRVLGNTSVSTAMDEAAYTRTTLHFSSVGDKLEGTVEPTWFST